MRGFRLAAAAGLLLAASAHAGWFRPRWTYSRPHFERHSGSRIAVAVGKAKDVNLALARSAAEVRARAALLRLLQRKPPFADVEGRVKGAVAAEVYDAGRGVVYVRVELVVRPARGP